MSDWQSSVPREVWALKMAVDELLEAHEAFDHATFYGEMNDVTEAQLRVDAARRRTRMLSNRVEPVMRQFQALDALLGEPEN